MTEILAVFRSRSQAIDCNARLKAFGIRTQLINTPREANIGCGLSLKLEPHTLERAKRVIRGANYSAFYGYFAMQTQYGRTIYGKIG